MNRNSNLKQRTDRLYNVLQCQGLMIEFWTRAIQEKNFKQKLEIKRLLDSIIKISTYV